MCHPRRVTGITNYRDFTFDGFMGVVLLFTNKKDGWAKYGCLGATFGCFWVLRGALEVTDGWSATPGQWLCWTNKKDLTFDGFKGAVSLFTYIKGSQANLGYCGGIFGHLGALRGPLGWQIGDAPPQEDDGFKDSIFDGFQEFFSKFEFFLCKNIS